MHPTVPHCATAELQLLQGKPKSLLTFCLTAKQHRLSQDSLSLHLKRLEEQSWQPLTFAAPPCRPRDSRSGGQSAAPRPTDAPSGSWPPARLCPAGRRLRARLPRERKPRASDLSGAEDRIQDMREEWSSQHSLDLLLDSLRSIFCCSLP